MKHTAVQNNHKRYIIKDNAIWNTSSLIEMCAIKNYEMKIELLTKQCTIFHHIIGITIT